MLRTPDDAVTPDDAMTSDDATGASDETGTECLASYQQHGEWVAWDG
jgi:hypothetical protein